MKALTQLLAHRLSRLSPAILFALALTYLVALAVIDFSTPPRMSWVFFYLAGIAVVAWRIGTRAAWALSLLSVLSIAGAEIHALPAPFPAWTIAWNAATRFFAFIAVAWLVAETTRLNSRLHHLVQERTAQWQAEAEQHRATSSRLFDTLERFEQLVSNITEVFWLCDLPVFKPIYVSPGYETIWGRRCEDLYRHPHTWLAALHPDDRDEIAQRIPSEQPAGKYDAEYRILRPDGSLRWIRDRAFPVRNTRGEVYRIAGIAEDITERKRAEEILKTQAAIIEHMAEAAVMTDEHGIITLTNPALDSLLGYDRRELAGQSLVTITGLKETEFRAALDADITKIRTTGQITDGEYVARRKDGSFLHVATRSSGVSVGGRFFLIIVGQDITERKRLELMKETFLELGGTLSVVRTPLDAARAILTSADKLWELHSATLDIYFPESDRMKSVLTCDTLNGRRQEVPAVRPFGPPTPRMLRIMREGAELILRDSNLQPLGDSFPFGDTSRLSASIMCVPLRRDARPVGTVSIQSYTLNAYTQEDLRTFQALADHCAGALDRIRVEEALRESEEYLQAFYDSPGGLRGIVELLDDDILVLSANAPQATAYGRTVEGMRNMRASELGVPRSVIDLWLKHFRQSQRSNEPVSFEYSSQFRSPGSWGSATVSPVRLDPGSPPRFAYLALDVTERRRTEQQLSDALDLNRRILAASPIGIAAYKSTGECVFANEALAAISGGTVTQLIGQNFRRLTSWIESDLVTLADEALNGASASPAEIHSHTSFGNDIWGEFRMARFARAGESHLLVMVHDISQRKLAEEALRDSENRLRAIVTGAPVVLFAVAPDGAVTFEAGQAVKALDTHCGPRVGRSVFEVFADSPVVLQNVRRALLGEEFSSFVTIGAQSFDCWYSPTRDADGRITGLVGVGTNITERLRLERQILEISDREQARIGQDIHDGLCQSLVTIAFDANGLHRDLTQRRLPQARTAKKIADLLDGAITESRSLARGLFPIRLETTGLAPALEELAAATQDRFKIQCRFTTTGSAVVPNSTLATHLYRIAQEAVANAVKHSRAQIVSISLRARSDSLELVVKDNGVGLPASPSESPNGMGLHIMHYRSHTIGASLHVAPGPNGGTLVSCRIHRPTVT